MMEVVRTGVAAAAGSEFKDMDEVVAEAGADSVWVWAGGFCRYGIKERTLCSAFAGVILVHYQTSVLSSDC